MRRLRAIDYLYINIYWFGLAFMWNSLHPIILPAILLRFVPEELKNTYLGGLTFIGLILAMIVQPLAGAVSDRSAFRWGRRRPYILMGSLFDFIFLAMLGLAGNYWLIFIGYTLLQIASNTAHGPCQGFIPDLVPPERRGIASGIKNLFDMGGFIVASLAAGRLMGGGNAALAFLLIGLILLGTLLITLFGVREEPSIRGSERPPAQAIGESLVGTLRLDYKRYPDYTWLVVSRFLILLGIYGAQAFAFYYIRDAIKAPNPAIVTGDLMFAIGIALILLAYPSGYFSDRTGRKPLNAFSGLLGALGIFLLLFADGRVVFFTSLPYPWNEVTDLELYGSLVGAAMGIFLSVNWALFTDLVPKSEAGKYMGLTNLATAGAGAASRLEGPIIDFFNARRPGAYQGYSVLFILSSLFLLAGTALLAKVREIKVKE